MAASMIPVTLERLVTDGFSMIPSIDRGVLVIRVSGNGDMDAIQPLNTYLKEVRREVDRLGVRRVKFDFSDLYFLNSSCLKAFVSWIVPLSTLPQPPYQIVFAANPKLHWQTRSLNSLQRVAPRLVVIETAVPA